MTDNAPPAPVLVKNAIPHLRSRWWTVLLVVSLGVNLLIAGMVAGRILTDRHSASCLKALANSCRASFLVICRAKRRQELLSILRDNRDEFKTMREQAQATALKLADVLDDPNYDSEKAKSVIAEFTTGANSLASRGGAVSMALLDKLTADERVLLANEIRDRAAHEKGMH